MKNSMDNLFFRQCFPYKVAITENKIEVYNRQYGKIFKGLLPNSVDKEKLFSSIAADRPDCVRSNECFMYDDQTNPVANEKGFSRSLYNEYEKRMLALLEFMREIEPFLLLHNRHKIDTKIK